MNFRSALKAFWSALHTRSYAAASGSPRWPATSSMPAPVAQTHAAAPLTGSRAAFYSANTPLGSSIGAAWVDNVLPDAPSVQLNPRNRIVEQDFQLVLASILAALRTLERSFFTYGEGLAVFRYGNMPLQVLNPEQLDRTINRDLANGSRIVQGVEEDAYGEVVAYWILPDAPDQAFAAYAPARRFVANDVVHYYEAKFPGQRRGISAFASVLPRLQELEKLNDAALTKQGTAALFTAFVTDVNNSVGTDGTAEQMQPMGPGATVVLPMGRDVKFPNMPEAGDTINLIKSFAREICAACGVPYILFDVSDTNYSSGKLGIEQFKRRLRAHRASLLVPLVLEPLYRRWTLLRLLSGEPASTGTPSFLFPDFASLEPKKEMEADVLAINSGIRSRAEIIAARGRDISDVDSEINADTFEPKATPQAGQTQENNEDA